MDERTLLTTIEFKVTSMGGVFSKFMFYVFNYPYQYQPSPNNDNIYLSSSDRRANKNGNPFDFVFEQYTTDCIKTLCCGHQGNKDKNNQILMDYNLGKYKESVKALNFNQEMVKLIESEKHKVGQDVLGVHVRVTDMNIIHGGYGIFTTQNYIDRIKQYDSNKKIFVASDNNESIEILKEEFGDRVLYVENLSRADRELDNTYSFQEDNISEKFLWQEAFLEMFLLSMCGSLLVRTSNLSNAAMIYADMEQNIDWL